MIESNMKAGFGFKLRKCRILRMIGKAINVIPKKIRIKIFVTFSGYIPPLINNTKNDITDQAA